MRAGRYSQIHFFSFVLATLVFGGTTKAQNATQGILVVENGGYVLNLPYAAAMTQAAVQELVASVNNKTILAAEVGAVVFTSVNACPLRDTGPGGARLSLRPMLLFPMEIWERCAIGFGMCLGNDKTTIESRMWICKVTTWSQRLSVARLRPRCSKMF